MLACPASSMLNNLCLQIVEVVQPRREALDACLVFPSMPAVMRLNKLGTFSMSQLGQSRSPVAEFMKNMRKSNDNFEESMLKLVRTLPAVLKFLPSQKAQVGPLTELLCPNPWQEHASEELYQCTAVLYLSSSNARVICSAICIAFH